jgi:hypothetical protein
MPRVGLIRETPGLCGFRFSSQLPPIQSASCHETIDPQMHLMLELSEDRDPWRRDIRLVSVPACRSTEPPVV